jgi:hypothetical protein
MKPVQDASGRSGQQFKSVLLPMRPACRASVVRIDHGDDVSVRRCHRHGGDAAASGVEHDLEGWRSGENRRASRVGYPYRARGGERAGARGIRGVLDELEEIEEFGRDARVSDDPEASSSREDVPIAVELRRRSRCDDYAVTSVTASSVAVGMAV